MRLIPGLFCVLCILHCSYAPPVTPEKDNEKDSDVKDNLDEYMEYHRYLKEVVQTLENDPEFRERLEKADEDDIRSGKIAEQLDFVNHNVRTKLDEIKRRELERLRHLATKKFELTNNLDTSEGSHDHLDHSNPHTFEIEDLMRLITKTTADLEKADKQRKEQFKEYEMQKEFEKNQKLEHLDEEHKKQYLETIKKEEEAKKHHQPVHHPGSKQQLEEVWEKTDHQDQKFDPKVFFMMHDVDGNGVWDADEVKALFIKELNKIYGPDGPNKDLHERAEEMERMREHVFRENDKNQDGLIDFNEFMLETQKENFNKDEGWKTIDDENQVYTQQEYDEYQRRRLDEVTYLQQRGLVDANFQAIPGAEHQIHEALREFHAYRQKHGDNHQYPPHGYPQHPSQGQYPPGQHPPQGYYPPGQHPAQGQYPPGQHPSQGQYPPAQHPSQGQYPPAQHPPQGQGYQQVPVQNYHQPQGQAYQQPGQHQQPGQAQYQQPGQGQYQQQQGQNLNQIPQQHHAPLPQSGPPNSAGHQQMQPPQTQQINQAQPPVSQGQPQLNQGQPQQTQGQPQVNQGQNQQNQGQLQNPNESQQNLGQQNQGHPQQNQGHPQQNQGHPQQNQGHPQQNQGASQNQGH